MGWALYEKITSKLTVGLQKWKVYKIPLYVNCHHFMNPVHDAQISKEDKIIFL